MIVTANGVDLHVEVHGDGDGDPVILLHGWPDDAGLWRNQVPALTGAGHRVIAPDLRGFGRSGRPADVKGYRLANSVADVAAVLDAAGAPAAHVVGHDWGAAGGLAHRDVPAGPCPHPDGAFRAAPGRGGHHPLAGNGLVAAVLPVRGDSRGHA